MEATINQLSFIETIEEVLNIKFDGKTKLEASEFISKNIESFKHQQMLDNIDDFTSKY